MVFQQKRVEAAPGLHCKETCIVCFLLAQNLDELETQDVQ